jgi:hypothetical protein
LYFFGNLVWHGLLASRGTSEISECQLGTPCKQAALGLGDSLMWDNDYINEEVPGFFAFGEKNLGAFHFGYCQGELDYRLMPRDGKPAVEFSFTGFDQGGGDE